MVSDERAEKALRYLAETDLPCAEAKANMERMEFKAKAIKQAIFIHNTGTVAERQAQADTHLDHVEAMDEYFASVQTYSQMMNKRQTEAIVIEVWRSIQANRRRGE